MIKETGFKGDCDCPQLCNSYSLKMDNVSFPLNLISIDVDGVTVTIGKTVANNTEFKTAINNALYTGGVTELAVVNGLTNALELSTNSVVEKLEADFGNIPISYQNNCPTEAVVLPFAVIGGKIQYDPQTKKAVLVPDGTSGLGAISVSAINWTSFGGATVTTTNVANDTLDFASDPLFNGVISVDFTVTSGAATSTARSTALVSVPDNAAYIFASPLFSMATLGQLQITGGSTIVGAVFTEASPIEDGYNLNGTGDTVFTSPTTITVTSGDSIEVARSSNTQVYYKRYNQYYIYF